MSVLNVLNDKFDSLRSEIKVINEELEDAIKAKEGVESEIAMMMQKLNSAKDKVDDLNNQKKRLEAFESELSSTYQNILDSATNLLETLNSQY